MKALRILILLIIFPISSNCQEEYKNIEDMARKNSTYRIIETKYIWNERDFTKTDSLMYEFNSDYKISGIKDLKVISYPMSTKIFKYNSKKMLIGGDENEKLTFNLDYDANGLLKSKKFYNKSGKVVNSVRYQYDANKKLKKIKSSINNYQIENLYLNDLLVKSVITNNSRNKTEIEYNYDSYKNLISEKSFRSLKDSKKAKRYFDYKIEYKYNTDNLISEKYYYLTENLFEKIIYTYDENQSLVKWEKFNNQNKAVFLTTYN